jgi:hypothetical protein
MRSHTEIRNIGMIRKRYINFSCFFLRQKDESVTLFTLKNLYVILFYSRKKDSDKLILFFAR